MTREEKIEAFAMRLDGETYQEIADKFGVTRQYIHQMLGGDRRSKVALNDRGFIYPNLMKWMIENGVPIYELYKKMGYKSSDCSKIYQRLRGESRFTISDIRKILEITKLSFEECFEIREGATEVSDRRLQS